MLKNRQSEAKKIRKMEDRARERERENLTETDEGTVASKAANDSFITE